MKAFLVGLAVFIVVVSCGFCGIGGWVYFALSSSDRLILGTWRSTQGNEFVEYQFTPATMKKQEKKPGSMKSFEGNYQIEGDLLTFTHPKTGKVRERILVTKDELVITIEQDKGRKIKLARVPH